MIAVLIGTAWLGALIAALAGSIAPALALVVVGSVAALHRAHRALMVAAATAAAAMLVLGPLLHRYGTTVLVEFGPLSVTAEGVQAGAEYAARLAAAILAVEVLVGVPVVDIVMRVARWLPSAAFTAAVAVRLGPLLQRDIRAITEELSVRGADVGASTTVRGRVQALGAIFDAFVTGMFERAFALADALRSRGYGGQTPVNWKPLDGGGSTKSAGLGWVGAVAGASAAALAVVAPTGGAMPYIVGVLAGTAAAAAIAAARPRHRPKPAPHPEPATLVRRERPGGGVLVEDLSVERAGQLVFAGMSFSVEPGSWTTILGDSGSGKSTLLGLLSGHVPMTSRDRVAGSIHTSAVPGPLGIGVVFQDPEKHLVLPTVAEEVALPLRWTCENPATLEQLVRTALAAFGIAHLAGADTAHLSGGEAQLVQLAAACVTQPQVLILDEPFSQLDTATAYRTAETLVGLTRHWCTTVIHVEHDPARIAQVADRVLVIRDRGIGEDCDLTTVGDDNRLSVARGLIGAAPTPPATAKLPAAGVRRLRASAHASAGPAGELRLDRMELSAGHAAALVAPTGAGKTTMLRCLAGFGGDSLVQIDGVGRGAVPLWHQLAYVAQHAGPSLSGITVEQVVTQAATWMRQPVDHALEPLVAAGLEPVLDAHPMDLSVGQRQRLAIVAGTLGPAPVWLLDEPSRGLDEVGRKWLMWYVRQHLNAGGTALMATHDVQLAAGLGCRLYTIDAHGWVAPVAGAYADFATVGDQTI